jgi:hypothetical protein
MVKKGENQRRDETTISALLGRKRKTETFLCGWGE